MSLLGWQGRTLAHGVSINYAITQAIAIQAAYDTGEPMAKAQVIVYAPDNPSTPWQKGMTDEKGKFIFIPDRAKAGNWEVTVRQAGHGDVIVIPVESQTASNASPTLPTSKPPETKQATSSSPGTLTPLQKGLMSGSVIWGFVGTALFFARRKK
ncbi:MAG: carboxypeptidase regulatory-like domain-containing protein [Hydrococcus sp. RU_2_2]|nr:carboxypeptidase regulatory-like domain-containing protein [Hydrococcus sp. RU_2_2]NJP18554.1 carboxypeptidase regulatory-like domain-containing protein [Hydrococcus sp. CRU_1_1]